jgi:hypothetical protein
MLSLYLSGKLHREVAQRQETATKKNEKVPISLRDRDL